MDPPDTESSLEPAQDTIESGPPPDDDAGGIESKLRMGRAIKSLLKRDPQPVTVGRYRIDRRLGTGGMSVVYAARDDELNREVAIKLLKSSTASAPGWNARLRKEASAMAKLGHVNIAHVYEVGEHDGCPFIAMELISGHTFREWLAERPRSVPEVIAMYVQAARGLAAAHAAGLVHRDFKPDNVLVDQHGWARVLDFGLVLAPSEAADEHDIVAAAAVGSEERIGQTLPGTVLGTPAYMAPEQMGGQEVDARADQFSLCVALYEALHGERPFKGKSLTEISDSLRERKAEPVAIHSDNIPPAIAEVIAKGLEIEPNDRFESMDALIDALTIAQQQRERAKHSELQRRAGDLAYQESSDQRGQYAGVIGVAMAALVGLLYVLRVTGIHEAGYADAIAIAIVMSVVYGVSEHWVGATDDNAFSRRWSRAATFGPAVLAYTLGICWLVGLSFNHGLAMTLVAAGAAAVPILLFIEPRQALGSVFLFVAAPAIVLVPEYRPLWLVLGVGGFYAAVRWALRGAQPLE